MAVASQTLTLGRPTSISHLAYSLVASTGYAFYLFSSRNSRPKINHLFSPKSNFYKPHNNLTTPLKPYYTLACSSKINPSPSPLTEPTRPVLPESTPPHQNLTESTRTVSTLVATAILLFKLSGHAIANYVQGVCKMPSPNQLLTVQENMISTTRPLLFAAIKIYRKQLDTPWTIMAFGLAKCIEVFMAALAIRSALSMFPSVEWNQQPYSGLRDMCDPVLSFFQSIVPPVFDSLDISASVAFLVLTVLVEILTSR